MENQFSKIILGTVQLGMPYGVGRWANELMPEAEAFRILDAAWEMGITTLDTSPDYGLAEMRLAKYMKANPAKCFHIISKIKNIPLEIESVRPCIGNWFEDSPFHLLDNCRSLSLLLHREADIYRDEVVKQLNIEVKTKRLSCWGVSVYQEDSARVASTIETCAMIQLPFNAFNQAFGRNGVIELLSNRGKTVMARSVFLQGLLLQSRNRLHELGERNAGIAEKLFFSLRRQNASVHEFAMSVALAEAGINNLVLGVDTHEQLIAWNVIPNPLDKFDLPASLLDELRHHDSQKLNPQHWKKHAD